MVGANPLRRPSVNGPRPTTVRVTPCRLCGRAVVRVSRSAVLMREQPRRTPPCPRARSPPADARPRTSSPATARRPATRTASAPRRRGCRPRPQKPGSKSPGHRGYRADAPEAPAKKRWTAHGAAGRDEARGIRTHSASDRPRDDRPARSYDDRPARSYDNRPPRSNDDRPARSYDNRPPRSNDDRPARSYDRPVRQSGDARPARDFGTRPPRSYDDRPARSYDNRPPRSNDDRPARSYERPPGAFVR